MNAGKTALFPFAGSPEPCRRVRRLRPDKSGFSFPDPAYGWLPEGEACPVHPHWRCIPETQRRPAHGFALRDYTPRPAGFPESDG